MNRKDQLLHEVQASAAALILWGAELKTMQAQAAQDRGALSRARALSLAISTGAANFRRLVAAYADVPGMHEGQINGLGIGLDQLAEAAEALVQALEARQAAA